MGVPWSSTLPAGVVWESLRSAFGSLAGADSTGGLSSVAEADSSGGFSSVAGAGASGEPLHVIDLGGGTGGLAVAVAELGHRVTVVDPSPDALAALERRAVDAGVSARIHGSLGDAGTLASLVGTASADVVVCHGVLEVVDEPAQALLAAAAVLRPGGFLSVLVAQHSGAVLARVVAGQIDEAAAMLRVGSFGTGSAGAGSSLASRSWAGRSGAGRSGPGRSGVGRGGGPRRFTRAGLEALVVESGFAVEAVRGVRMFSEHGGSRAIDIQPRATTLLEDLEAAVCADPDFLPIATQLHLLARRC